FAWSMQSFERRLLHDSFWRIDEHKKNYIDCPIGSDSDSPSICASARTNSLLSEQNHSSRHRIGTGAVYMIAGVVLLPSTWASTSPAILISLLRTCLVAVL